MGDADIPVNILTSGPVISPFTLEVVFHMIKNLEVQKYTTCKVKCCELKNQYAFIAFSHFILDYVRVGENI